jgi:ATPase subunit of ABC transporter with duplicated ATPase domains
MLIAGQTGSGKSTLLRIIAGVDKEYQGEIAFTGGYSIGLLEQEPQLDPTKTVKEVVEEGVHEIVALLKEFEDINMKFAEPMSDDEMTKLIEKQGVIQEKLDHVNAWELDTKLDRGYRKCL